MLAVGGGRRRVRRSIDALKASAGREFVSSRRGAFTGFVDSVHEGREHHLASIRITEGDRSHGFPVRVLLDWFDRRLPEASDSRLLCGLVGEVQA